VKAARISGVLGELLKGSLAWREKSRGGKTMNNTRYNGREKEPSRKKKTVEKKTVQRGTATFNMKGVLGSVEGKKLATEGEYRSTEGVAEGEKRTQYYYKGRLLPLKGLFKNRETERINEQIISWGKNF